VVKMGSCKVVNTVGEVGPGEEDKYYTEGHFYWKGERYTINNKDWEAVTPFTLNPDHPDKFHIFDGFGNTDDISKVSGIKIQPIAGGIRLT